MGLQTALKIWTEQNKQDEANPAGGRRTSRPKPTQASQKPELFAEEAREHTLRRLLGYRVCLKLKFCDPRGNLYGQISLEVKGTKRDIGSSLVNAGYAAVVPWPAEQMGPEGKQLFATQARAIGGKMKIWSIPADQRKQTFASMGFISAAKANQGGQGGAGQLGALTGTVTSVRSGDCLKVKLDSGETKEYFLASIRAYRYEFGPNDDKPRNLGQGGMTKHMSAAREFVRKETMAFEQKVTVEEEYTRPVPVRGQNQQSGGKNNAVEAVKKTTTRVYANIFVNKPNGQRINLGVELCRAGLAGVVNLGVKESDRSKHYTELVNVTKAARDNKIGYYAEKYDEELYFDLTVRSNTNKGLVETQSQLLW